MNSPVISRRAFLGSGAASVAAVYVPRLRAAEPIPTRQLTRGAAQVFVNLDQLEAADNIHQLFHTAEKHPANPVLLGRTKWERKQGGPCGAFNYDAEEKLFKVWYQGVIGTEFGQPQYGPHTLNYATSPDGIVWERPDLGLHEVTWNEGGTRHNNVVVPQTHHDGQDHWESVLKDPRDADARRRYKALGWSSHDWDGPMSGIYSMTSPDGLRWTHVPEPLFHYHPREGTEDLGPVGDAQTLMIDAAQNRYVAFLRGLQGERLFSISDDFVRWSPPAVSMPAVSGVANTYYSHLGFLYGDHYLGVATHYAIETDGVHHLRVRLLTSPDGLHYSLAGPQALDRPALIDVGDYGEWDRFMCMLTGAPPIPVGDKLYLYYRGYSETHDRRTDKPPDSYYAGGNGLATLRLDGFASLAAGFDGGTATTQPIVFSGESLTVNAKANFYGGVTVEILDELGRPLEHYTETDCIPMTADSVQAPIAWKERMNVAELASRPVKLRFHLKNARLYAYRIIGLLIAAALIEPSALCRAQEFSATLHQRRTIYHSPQTPGFTSWVGAWTMPDASLMVSFTQATGPLEGRPPGPADVLGRLNWPPAGHPGYDMTGLDLRNVHLRSTDAGETWRQVSADAFKSCMNGVTNEAQTALADGTVLRGVFGFYLPYDADKPQTGFLERSVDATQTWGNPEVPLDAKEFTTWPRRLRVLRDGRIVLLAGVVRAPAGSHTRAEFSALVEPAILVSSDAGRTWNGPVAATSAAQRGGWTEEFDVAELANGDLLAIYRRASDAQRWQSTLQKSGDTWIAQRAEPSVLPHSGQPELLVTREGPVLHLATSGIHATSDAGQTWHRLELPGTGYYPRSVQAADGRVFVFGHVGGDDEYGKVDQSIVMDSFRLSRRGRQDAP